MTQASETVRDGKVVTIHYTLTDDDGETLESSGEGEPLLYLHGAENIVPGLERALLGRAVGEVVKVVVPPVDGYGERSGGGVQAVPKKLFDGAGPLERGMPFEAEGPDGETLDVWVVDVDDETVYVDTEHPLAGVTLHFEVELIAIRDATADELEHGHPHDGGEPACA